MSAGFVSLVGAGPGDPGLLTLAGRDRLAEADVVVYDRLVSRQILDHAPRGVDLVFAGKEPGNPALSQDEINALLIDLAHAGKRVVRLKGGDPFVFGRGGEEALALAAAGVPFDVIPGVTSAVAVPAYAGVPVTHRGIASSFAVVTGHEDDSKDDVSVDWSKLALAVDTLVVLMGGAALPGVAAALIAAGRPPETPAISVEWGTTSRQRTVSAPLCSIASAVQQAGLGTPLLTVIGDVASLRDHISWFESRPLFGKRVLVTRAAHQADALADLLRREGALPVELPALEIVPVVTEEVLKTYSDRLKAAVYAWCPFTSTNAVDVFFETLERLHLDARVFVGCRVAAIGAATAAALRRHGISADIVASQETSEGLLDALDAMRGRVLLPCAADTRPLLAEGLRALGMAVDELMLYETRPPAVTDAEALALVRDGAIDAVTFASSSAVRNLAGMLGDAFPSASETVIACIGGVTAQTAREHGLTVHVEPETHTIPALVEALRDYFAARPA